MKLLLLLLAVIAAPSLFWWVMLNWPRKDYGAAERKRRKSLGY